jgi:hypothetical protein
MFVSPTVPLLVCLHAYLFACLHGCLLICLILCVFHYFPLPVFRRWILSSCISFLLSFVSYLMNFTEVCSVPFTGMVLTYTLILFHLKDLQLHIKCKPHGRSNRKGQHAAVIWRFLKSEMCFLRNKKKRV